MIVSKKKLDKSINFQNLATSMRIHKAYLSQVIKGERDLSQDQLYLACKYLDLKDHEYDYLKLLLEYARCGLEQRKQELKKTIKEIQKSYKKTTSHIDVKKHKRENINRDDYFLDPLNQVVHMCLSIPKYKKDPKSMAQVLFIPQKKIVTILQKLESMKIIKIESGQVTDQAFDLHLPRNSALFSAWNSSLNDLAMNRIKIISENKSYNFAVIFGANEAVKNQVHDAFLQFLKKVKKLVEKADPIDEVFQMRFDLFSWTNC